MSSSGYVMLTAARNEERFIAETIESVVSQSIKPRKWVIVSDGSTDGTDEIVTGYSRAHDFITLVRRSRSETRSFGSKAIALNEAYAGLKDLPHEFVAILDADVTLPRSYYEQIIRRFDLNPSLGLAGGVLHEIHNGRYSMQRTSPQWSVSGPIQMFRRPCFAAIGGYTPVRKSVDGVAEVMARMHGWKVQAFPDVIAYHRRETGTYTNTLWRARFVSGVGYHAVGYHPLYILIRCLSRLGEKPMFAGSFLELLGYLREVVLRHEMDVPQSYVCFARREQMNRLREHMRLSSFSRRSVATAMPVPPRPLRTCENHRDRSRDH